MHSDADLLGRYVSERSEAAFAELVRVHLNLVYFAALRQLGGDVHRAQDVTQAVFADLARKAASLRGRVTLTGWLHTSTRYAVLALRRAENTRRKYEQEVGTMPTIQSDENWEQVRPLIDEVIQDLNERDREAVLLRFFEARSFGEISATCRLSEDAARMRVDRALEKIRVQLERRGIRSATAALGAALAAQGALAAPQGLASAVAATAFGSVATSTAATLTFMSTTKFLLGGLVVVIGVAVFWRQQGENTRLSDALAVARAETAQVRRTQPDMLPPIATRTTSASSIEPPSSGSSSPTPRPAVSAEPVATAKVSLVLAKDLKPVTNAGWETPRAAAETVQWAMNGGDVATLAGAIALTSVGRKDMEKAFAHLPAEKQAEFGSVETMLATLLGATTAAAGFQVMADRPGALAQGSEPDHSADPNYHTVHVQRQYEDGRVREQDLVFQSTAGGWRWVVPDFLVTKATVEAGLPRPANGKVGG